MLKKILTGTVAVFFAAGLAAAANLSIFSGPQDPSQLLATVNQLVQNINFGVNGRLTAVVTGTLNTLTSEQTLASYTLPANRLATTGDAVLIKCWGQFATNTDTKSVKIYFGSTGVSSVSIGSNPSNKSVVAEMLVVRAGAASQNIATTIAMDLTAGSVNTNVLGVDSFAANQTIKCTGTSASASDFTLQGMLVQQVK